MSSIKQKFNINKKYEKLLKNGKQIGIQVAKKNKKLIKQDEIRKFYDTLTQDGSRIMIRALAPTGWMTLSSFQDGLLLQDYYEYFEGKVKNASNFDQFEELELVILK